MHVCELGEGTLKLNCAFHQCSNVNTAILTQEPGRNLRNGRPFDYKASAEDLNIHTNSLMS